MCLYTPGADLDVVAKELDAGLQKLDNRMDNALVKKKNVVPEISTNDIIATFSFALAILAIPLLVVSHCRRSKYIW